MKKCTRCKRELPLEMFTKNQITKSGLEPFCRECNRVRKYIACNGYDQIHGAKLNLEKAYQVVERAMNRLREAEALIERTTPKEEGTESEIKRTYYDHF